MKKMGDRRFCEYCDEKYRMTHTFAQSMADHWKWWDLAWHLTGANFFL
jgi:hypothetical protein